MTPLVLIPGLGSDAAVWRLTIEALGEDADCLVGDTLLDDSLPAMAARILARAPARFALAGVSMGGMAALEIMRTAPERVTRLALLDTNARPDAPEQTAIRKRTNEAVLATDDFGALAALGTPRLVHRKASAEVRRALDDMAARVGRDVYLRQNRAVMARGDLRPVLATIRAPTIVIVGAEDVVTPPALSEEIRDGIPGARLHVIPDCGHLPPIEKPDAVAALFREWLAL